MVVKPTSWLRFFVGAVMSLAVGLDRANGLTISGAVLTGVDIAIDFSGLSLW